LRQGCVSGPYFSLKWVSLEKQGLDDCHPPLPSGKWKTLVTAGQSTVKIAGLLVAVAWAKASFQRSAQSEALRFQGLIICGSTLNSSGTLSSLNSLRRRFPLPNAGVRAGLPNSRLGCQTLPIRGIPLASYRLRVQAGIWRPAGSVDRSAGLTRPSAQRRHGVEPA